MKAHPAETAMVERAARRELVWVDEPGRPSYLAKLLFWGSRPKVILASGAVKYVAQEDVRVK